MKDIAQSSVWRYLGVFLLLLVLTGGTVALASLDLGRWNLAAALSVAAFKAGLVAWAFMHLGAERGVTRLFAVAGLFWMAILLLGALLDALHGAGVISPFPGAKP